MKQVFAFAVSAAVVSIGAIPVASFAAQDTAKADKPNIVLIVADDLGINDLHCYGRKEHNTPNLDRLASQGMRFTCAYAAQPVCSPSRAAIMTGKWPARLHLTTFLPGRADAPSQQLLHPRIEGQLPLEEVTLAELLKAAGYATGHFGKWHLGDKGFGPAEQGFDVVLMPPANTEPTEDTGGKGEYIITAAAEKFMEEHRDRPFFCYVPHNNPHIPLAALPQIVEKHRDAFHPVYAAMIETLDDAVGRLMTKVDSLGLTDRTIFIFTSDNGGLHVLESPGTPGTHNTPFRAGKGFVYEGGLRVPMIVRWPHVVTAGTTCETPVVNADLFPTLLEAAGIDAAMAIGPVDGVSISKLLQVEPLPERNFYWHFPHYSNQGNRPAGAIRHGEWKLIEHFEDGSVELYNLAEDAGERNDCDSSEPDRAAELLGELRAWRTRVGAQMPTPNPEFDADKHRRLYVEQDPSRLTPDATAAATAQNWKAWRKAMNAATKGNRIRVTPATGDIRLHAREARVHGQMLRYEPQPNKNVLGYWTNADDWAEWDFSVEMPGQYEVEIQQGCGNGSGGAQVAVEIGDQALNFEVHETGHFQQMIQIVVGEVELTGGKHTLAVKPKSKSGKAVMDLRRVVLRPAR